ncbi:HNH endonuclease [Cenarchaeum symbiosum A]|uniref:HNH endonuclease n=1 Tax=Cenarchaeum symbiosum (strain A) TaxID=414004 RepID=A0RYS0_CENSY|nr:HNH endonuclease [Cenarchaeum symbiosum A]
MDAVPSDAEMRRIFLRILTRGPKDNTYKFALARAMLDHCNKHYSYGSDPEMASRIPYEQLAESFLKYYWHQECLFRIKQDFHIEKMPRAVRIVRDIFEHDPAASFGRADAGCKKKAQADILKRVFGHADKKTSFVVPRFQKIGGMEPRESHIFYRYSDDDQELVLYPHTYEFFAKNYGVLFRAVLLEWARFLERINTLPRLVAKIESAMVRRGSLTKYVKIFRDCSHCFYCETELEKGGIHVDHFIPWSYIFDDSVWNLVLSCPGCNISKRDSLAPRRFVGDLIVRNKDYRDRIRELELSLRQLETDRKWETEINNSYKNCHESGFSTWKGPQAAVLK